MFCKNCGNNLSDDARFCNVCGTPVDAIQPAGSVAPKEPNPMFANFLAYIKGFFSSKTTETVTLAAKSKSLEWIIFIAANVLTFALSFMLNVKYMMGSNETLEVLGNNVFNYFLLFLINLFAGSVVLFALAGGLFLCLKLIFKRDVSLFQALNIVSYATIPVTAVCTANIILGLIAFPISIITYVVGILGSCCLLYVGVQKTDEEKDVPYFLFIAVLAVAAALGILITLGLYGIVIESGIENAMNSLFGNFGSLANLF